MSKKLSKSNKPKIGDVHVTSNFRLGMKQKSTGKNGRMVVVTGIKDKPSINPIVSVTSKNSKSKNMTRISKPNNKFLKNNSAVLNQSITDIKSTSKEIKGGLPVNQKVDVTNNAVFSNKIARLHWKDKKAVLKNKK